MIVIYDFKEIRSKRDKFIEQTKFYLPYLKKYKMVVNFKGYTETWDEYFQVDNLDIQSLFNLTRELSLWKDYFANLRCMFRMKYNSAVNKKLYLEAFRTKGRTNKILEEKIEDCEDEIKFFREYIKLLYRQEKNFNRAAKHCLQLYDEGTRTYIKSIG